MKIKNDELELRLAIGKRIREWVVEKYGKVNLAAADLKMSPQSLNTYMVGKSKPATGMQHKLQKLGADVQYIMTGIRSTSLVDIAHSSNEVPSGTLVTQNGYLIPVKTVVSGEITQEPVLVRLLQELVKSNMLMEARLERLEISKTSIVNDEDSDGKA